MPHIMPVEKILESIVPIVYSAVGGMAHFLYQVSKDPDKWSLVAFGINIILAGFVGYTISGFLPADIQNNSQLFGSLMAISGFTTFPLLEFIEKEGWKIVIKRMLNIK